MSAVNALHEISMEVATALEKCLDVEPGHVAAVFFSVGVFGWVLASVPLFTQFMGLDLFHQLGS